MWYYFWLAVMYSAVAIGIAWVLTVIVAEWQRFWFWHVVGNARLRRLYFSAKAKFRRG